MRVIVSGRLKQRSYETREGEKRTVYEIEVDEVGPSLRNASAKVVKSTRSGGGSGFGGGSGQGNQGGYGGSAPRPAADDPWSADQGSDNGFSDEPPF
jgi:single-strand DNA-binding protein